LLPHLIIGIRIKSITVSYGSPLSMFSDLLKLVPPDKTPQNAHLERKLDFLRIHQH
jgi:hypothetical protein